MVSGSFNDILIARKYVTFVKQIVYKSIVVVAYTQRMVMKFFDKLRLIKVPS